KAHVHIERLRGLFCCALNSFDRLDVAALSGVEQSEIVQAPAGFHQCNRSAIFLLRFAVASPTLKERCEQQMGIRVFGIEGRSTAQRRFRLLVALQFAEQGSGVQIEIVKHRTRSCGRRSELLSPAVDLQAVDPGTILRSVAKKYERDIIHINRTPGCTLTEGERIHLLKSAEPGSR